MLKTFYPRCLTDKLFFLDDATWQLAMDHCNRAIGTLLTANNLKEFDLSEFIAANITEFWTANIIEVAHAVEYIGLSILENSFLCNRVMITNKKD